MGMKVALLRSALLRTISTVAETMKDVVQDSFEEVARNVGRWAKGTAILYGIGAALVLVALTALCLGLADLLRAAGLPPFAGYLIVAAVAGSSGYLLFRAGARRRVTPRSKGDSESKLRIQIVTPRATRRRVLDVRRFRRRREVRGPRAERWHDRSRESAVRAARRTGRVVIHVPDGRTPPS